MKKAISFLISLVMVISIAVPAFADVAGPYFNTYDVIVTAEEGIEATGYDNGERVIITIPKGTVITITGEDIWGENPELYSRYNGMSITIADKGIALVKDSVDGTNAVNLEESYVVRVITKDGIKIHSGPHDIYKTVGTVPYGTDITIEKVDSEFETGWAFISYKGVSGWISVYEYSADFELAYVVNGRRNIYGETYSDNRLYIISDYITLLDNPGDDLKTAKKISVPSGTEISYSLYALKPRSELYYVEYEGHKGWAFTKSYESEGIYVGDFADSFIAECILEKDSPLYKVENNNIVKTDKIIPVNTIITTIYEGFLDGYMYMINYGGEQYWVSVFDCLERHEESEKLLIIDPDGVNAYSSILCDKDANAEEVVIKQNDVIKPVFFGEEQYGFMLNGELYWINDNDKKIARDEVETLIVKNYATTFAYPNGPVLETDIPINTVLRADYYFWMYNENEEQYDKKWYRVKYNDEYVWVADNYIEAPSMYTAELSDDLDVYTYYTRGEKSFTIPAGEKVVFVFYDESEESAYVEYQGKMGWVDTRRASLEIEKNDWETLDEDPYYYLFPEENPEAETVSRINDDDYPDNSNVIKIALICSAAAIVLVITAVVTISLIKKSRKSVAEAEEKEPEEDEND